jgi:hypothetical protein
MSRRKSEITGHMNERDFRHLVELAPPPGGFRSTFLEFDAFHRERTRVKREGDGVRAWHSLARLLKRMSDGGATIHGFRSSFADWCREQTNFPREIATVPPSSPRSGRSDRRLSNRVQT